MISFGLSGPGCVDGGRCWRAYAGKIVAGIVLEQGRQRSTPMRSNDNSDRRCRRHHGRLHDRRDQPVRFHPRVAHRSTHGPEHDLSVAVEAADPTNPAAARACAGTLAPSLTLTCNQIVAYWGVTNVFAALADPTRRGILERLERDGPQSIKAIAEPLEMTRQAVTKHLEVLEAAGLVDREVRGRERVFRLRADPLRVVDEWIGRYSALWDERLERLRRHVER